MHRIRFTIARGMIATAVLGLDLGLIRAFPEGGWDQPFYDVFLVAFALQLGTWAHLRSRGRARRFWLGFSLGALAATLGLLSCEFLPGTSAERFVAWMPDAASDFAYLHLPRPVDDALM